jgi:hypothetical protein
VPALHVFEAFAARGFAKGSPCREQKKLEQKKKRRITRRFSEQFYTAR